jgi:SAM-dependent methyltransferase
LPEDYYSRKLSAGKLFRVYEVAPPGVRRYLQAEIDFVLSKTVRADLVLELGCGYGRVLKPLSRAAHDVIGIDTSQTSLLSARDYLKGITNCHLADMNAINLAFPDGVFDVVVCIQNGVSAFHVDRRRLITESVRVAAPGGTILFSSYAERFWDDRLEWFRIQSREGLLGEIDESRTGRGVIVCKDGFTADTVGEEEFRALTAGLDVPVEITEVDRSSLFCIITR